MTITARADAEGDIQEIIEAFDVEYRTRRVKALDGEPELIKILVSAGQRAAGHLVDAVASLVRKFASSKKSAPQSGSVKEISNEEMKIDIELRRGDMVLTLKNASLREVKEVLELVKSREEKSE